MKITDYAPRTSPFDRHLLLLAQHDMSQVGIEIGVDVGAHAHSLLQYNPHICKLYLVDIWDKEYARGWVEGRMQTHGFFPRVEFMKMTSALAADIFKSRIGNDLPPLDFIYIDQLHDQEIVAQDMAMWWPLLRPGGILGYRNYSESKPFPGLNQALDEWMEKRIYAEKIIEAGEIIFVKP